MLLLESGFAAELAFGGRIGGFWVFGLQLCGFGGVSPGVLSFELGVVFFLLVALVLLAALGVAYLKRAMRAKISAIRSRASSRADRRRLVLTGLKLANSKMSEGRSE